MSITIHNECFKLADLNSDKIDKWKESCAQNFPLDSKYHIIYADPPWKYETSSNKLSNQCEAHYPVMSLSDLKQMDVASIAAKDCALYMWTSNPKLPEAIELVAAWGFKYKTIFKVWTKINNDGSNVHVPGWWSWSSTELLLVATRGSPLKHKCVNHKEQQVHASVRTIHSEKPDEIRESIENFMKCDKKIELFARKICTGWDAWGLEVPGFFHEDNSFSFLDENHRSIGIQVNLMDVGKSKNKKLMSSQKISSQKGPRGHKPDCRCCVCKYLK